MRQSIGGLELDWGRWDNVQITTRSGSAAIPSNDVEWAVFKPISIATLTGTYRYGTDSTNPLSGSDDTGNAIKGGLIEFDVNLAGGVDAISNGLLQVNDSRNLVWRVTFNGDIQGSFAKMTDLSGTFNGGGFVTGAINGAFIQSGSSGVPNTPDFLTGFSLQSGGNFVQGLGLLGNENCLSCTVVVLP